LSWLHENPVSTEYFVPQVEGREVKLAVEFMMHKTQQIRNVNT
jgi:hypothetical protein